MLLTSLPRGTSRARADARLLLAKGDYLSAIAVADVIDSPGASIHLLFVPASLTLRLEAASALGDEHTKSDLGRRIAALARK